MQSVTSAEKRRNSKFGRSNKEKSHCIEGDMFVASRKVKIDNLPET